MNAIAGVLWFSFLTLGVATIGSWLSRPGSERFGTQRYNETSRYNAPAAFFVGWGRLLPVLARATAVVGIAAIVAIVLDQ